MKALFLLSLLSLICLNAVSASHNYFLIERIKHEDLVPRHISGIVVDQTGYLWLATSDGLYRYDGKRYRVFKSESRNPSSLPNNNLRDVFIDSSGTIWVLSQGGGLSEYRPDTKDFENHKPIGDFPSSVTGTFDFWSIQQVDNTLFLSSFGGDGYFIFDLSSRKFHRMEVPLTSNRHFTQTTVIYQSANQSTWIGTDESGLLRMDSSGNLIKRYNVANGLLGSDRIRQIVEDFSGNIWVGTLGAGLYRISVETGAVIPTPFLDQVEGLTSGSVYTMYQETEDYLWIGTSVGLLIVNTTTNEIEHHYRHDTSSSFSLSNNDIRSIYRDNSGIYWIGTRNGGLNKLTRSQHFVNIMSQQFGGVLETGVVRAITIHNDKLWVGTEGGGITILSQDDYAVSEIILPGSDRYSGLNSDEITHFLSDPDEGIWVGTWGGGLHYLAPGSRSFISYRHNPSDETSLSDDRIQFTAIDSKGRYWVGTENGLNLFDRETSTFTRFISSPEDSNTLSSNSLQSLGFIEHTPDSFWIASWQGLNLFDISEKQYNDLILTPKKSTA